MSAMSRDLDKMMVIIDPDDEEGSDFSFFICPKGWMEFAVEEKRIRTDLVIKITGIKFYNEVWASPLENVSWGDDLTLRFGCA